MFKNFTDMCALLHDSTFKDFWSQFISRGFTKILKVDFNCVVVLHIVAFVL